VEAKQTCAWVWVCVHSRPACEEVTGVQGTCMQRGSEDSVQGDGSREGCVCSGDSVQ
jgi:hypothetical protein